MKNLHLKYARIPFISYILAPASCLFTYFKCGWNIFLSILLGVLVYVAIVYIPHLIRVFTGEMDRDLEIWAKEKEERKREEKACKERNEKALDEILRRSREGTNLNPTQRRILTQKHQNELDLLGLQEFPYKRDLKELKRNIVKKFHPDAGGTDAGFKKAMEAYEAIKNEY